MREEAVLLETADGTFDDNIAKALQFFGVTYSSSRPDAVVSQTTGHLGERRTRLFCSSTAFSALLAQHERHPERKASWQRQVHSAFVYLDEDNCGPLGQEVLRLKGARAEPRGPGTGEWIVTDKLGEFCGPMAGLRCQVTTAQALPSVFEGNGESYTPIILYAESPAFIKVDYAGVPVFVSAGSRVVDLDSELAGRNFDVSHHFLSAVPIVLYVKWAFQDTCWTAPEINACVVIDDPPLKPRYGFVNYRRLLEHINKHHFAATIAFIPWNWRRSDPAVVRLFTESPAKYSLCIHGCDHTAAEFGSADRNLLAQKAQEATDRMSRHQARTNIICDRVMVFPQGVFTRAAAGVLKQSRFDALVNTEVISSDEKPPKIRIADVWDIAVMNYDDLALFTRRYPAQGVVNFAFDALLGKPCLVVVHQDFCRDDNAHLVEFVNRLNALNCRFSWRTLGEVVRRSCRQRRTAPDLTETQMYGAELQLENRGHEPRRFRVTKSERRASTVKQVMVDSTPISWRHFAGLLSFDIDLKGGQSVSVRIVYQHHHVVQTWSAASTRRYKIGAMMRRQLSEVRDNYLSRIRWPSGDH